MDESYLWPLAGAVIGAGATIGALQHIAGMPGWATVAVGLPIGAIAGAVGTQLAWNTILSAIERRKR